MHKVGQSCPSYFTSGSFLPIGDLYRDSHRWSIAIHVRDVSEDEIQQFMSELAIGFTGISLRHVDGGLLITTGVGLGTTAIVRAKGE